MIRYFSTGGGGDGSAAWGSITGTLADQTDLQSALNAKAPLASPTFTGVVTTPSIKATTDGSGYCGGDGTLAASAGRFGTANMAYWLSTWEVYFKRGAAESNASHIWMRGGSANQLQFRSDVAGGGGSEILLMTLNDGGSVGTRTAILKGKMLAEEGIGVGNSAAATVPGTVTKKIEVFDAAGASIGFLAVFDAIA